MRKFISIVENFDRERGEPTADEIEAIVAALDAEGDVEIAGLRWKRSAVMNRMMGHEAWEKFLLRQFRTGDAASIHRAARNVDK